MDKYTIEELEEKLFSVSVPYRDSSAFQLALSFVKMKDKDLYKECLIREAKDCGLIEE